MPLIHSAAADSTDFACEQIETELRSSQNSPIVSIGGDSLPTTTVVLVSTVGVVGTARMVMLTWHSARPDRYPGANVLRALGIMDRRTASRGDALIGSVVDLRRCGEGWVIGRVSI